MKKQNIATFDDEYLKALGQVVINFNALDAAVCFVIWNLLEVKEQKLGQLVTAKLTFDFKTKILRDLIVNLTNFGKDFDPLYSRLQNAGEGRNDLSHSFWAINETTKKELLKTIKINTRKGFQSNEPYNFSKAVEEVSLNSLRSFINELNVLAIDLMNYFGRLR